MFEEGAAVNLPSIVEVMDKHLATGEIALARGCWYEAASLFSEGIRLATWDSCVDVALQDHEEHIWTYESTLGTLFIRRGLSQLAVADYASCLNDLSTASALMPDPIYALCVLSSIRATCDREQIHCPGAALSVANVAMLLSRRAPESRGVAKLTRALAQIAFSRFEVAVEELNGISEHERSSLPDYAVYLECARSRSTIRRSAAEYAARIQMMFSELVVDQPPEYDAFDRAK